MPLFALLAFPLVALAIFAATTPARGLVLVTLTGYMLLPENYLIDLPGLPAYEKMSAISLGLLLGALCFMHRAPAPEVEPARKRLFLVLVAVFLVLPLGTFLTNMNSAASGGSLRQGLVLRDLVSMIVNSAILLIPFLLARRFLYTETHLRYLLMAVFLGGFIYSFPVLFEVRMSPQLHIWVYGYFPHSWLQHLRSGAFRPIVFLEHGLWLGLFLLMSILAALALFRGSTQQNRSLYLFAAVWICVILFLSRNLGATLLVFLIAPVALLLTRKLQVFFVTAVAVLFLSFPAVRPVLPINQFMSVIEQIAPKRAASFGVRLENEDALLDRAFQKPLLGWGGWSRWRVFDEWGRDITLSDGRWVRILGQSGWLGYLAHFGFFTLPIFLLWRRRNPPPVAIGVAILIAGNLIYMIPNSALSPIGWMLAGALAGFVQARETTSEDAPLLSQTTSARKDAPVLTRFPNGPGSGPGRQRTQTDYSRQISGRAP